MDSDFEHVKPENWKWGIFYVNRRDNRLIVPKRTKNLGWTLNFAHVKVWIGLALILLIIIATELFFNKA
jgi:uncharacterized membrane protein